MGMEGLKSMQGATQVLSLEKTPPRASNEPLNLVELLPK
jgi:hypothetical protein